jgi:hypothetical protein
MSSLYAKTHLWSPESTDTFKCDPEWSGSCPAMIRETQMPWQPGHASVTITPDRYGHLMPGNEDESAALLDAYLDRASIGTPLRQLG